MAKTVFDVLKDRIEEQKSSATEFLAGGSAKDYAQYRDMCGLIRGLETAHSFVEDLSHNYMEDEDV